MAYFGSSFYGSDQSPSLVKQLVAQNRLLQQQQFQLLLERNRVPNFAVLALANAALPKSEESPGRAADLLRCNPVMSEDKQVLDAFKKKRLLLRIEKTNSPRTEVYLKGVCGQDVLCFGAERSKVRRQVQQYWNNVKRQSIRSYVRRLEGYGIVIGDGTRRELRQQFCGSENQPNDPIDENNAKINVDPHAMEKTIEELQTKLFEMSSQLATTQEQLADVYQSLQEHQQQLMRQQTKLDGMAKRLEDTEQRYRNVADSLALPTSESSANERQEKRKLEEALVEERDQHKATKRKLHGLESVKTENDDYDV
jgi:myosin heavy subunit